MRMLFVGSLMLGCGLAAILARALGEACRRLEGMLHETMDAMSGGA